MLKVYKVSYLVFIILGISFSGCKDNHPLSPDEVAQGRRNQVKDHLKTGLLALDQKDTEMAEVELRKGLAIDPRNGTIRTALASIYASKAGLEVKDWIDPLIHTSQSLSAKLKDLEKHNRMFVSNGSSSGQNIDSPEFKYYDKLSHLFIDFDKDVAIVDTILTFFYHFPMIADGQFDSLRKAIEILQEGESEPAFRADTVRTYLAILGFLKLLNEIKFLVNDPSHGEDSNSVPILCSGDTDLLKKHLREVQNSLLIILEGLVDAKSDPDNNLKKAKSQISFQIKKLLNKNYWSVLDVHSPADTQSIVDLLLEYQKKHCENKFWLAPVTSERTD